ncbi:NifU family protein [Campylobacterota bacterium]|nr:NifU family protein [Campylobacterota bacterium]
MVFPFSDEELLPAIERTIDAIRPALQKDGGDVELVRVRQKEVFVRLKGACVGCASSGSTLKWTIERTIKANIHPEMRVIDETGAIDGD